MIDDLYARAEGNPFFTEQLVAAALAGPAEGGLRVPAGLPARLAELLAARAGRCAGDARAVLAGAGGRGPAAGRGPAGRGHRAGRLERCARGLRELAAARLLAEDTAAGAHRPRHALLAEAVAAGLLPGERAVLHERAARALQAAGTRRWPRRWPGTGRPRAARPRSCRPGWRRPRRPSGCSATPRPRRTGSGPSSWARRSPMPPLRPGSTCRGCTCGPSTRFTLSGDGERAGAVAEEAYRRFADHPDPATAAVVRHRAAYFRGLDAPAAGLPLIEEALRLFEQAPPSSDHAEAWLDYASIFLLYAEGRLRGQPRPR